MPKPYLILLAATTAIALTSVGLVVWIAADPQYWFPGAYAQQGDRGDPGPRGPRGLIGPQGPVGDTAEGAVADLDVRVSELEDSIGTLKTTWRPSKTRRGPARSSSTSRTRRRS
jgi:hypothetical protein